MITIPTQPPAVHTAETAPIFVFGSFRGSSTWMWSKFRSAPTTLAYYEIFHEQLKTLSAATMADYGFDSWKSKHPRSAPYFLEYAPLLREEGGLASYDPRMAFERFIPADGIDGHLSPEEKRYIGELTYQAQLSRRIPVLTCNRSLGRARAILKEFGGTGVLVCRNLFHQWASYSGQLIGSNSYFMDTIDLILNSSSHDPFLRMLNNWFGGRSKSPDDEKTFTTFFLMHLYLYGFAFDACDLVVDVSALANDPELNRSMSSRLSHLVHANIDLSDVREEFEIATVDIPSRESFITTIEQFVKIISGFLPSRRSIIFVEQIKDAAIVEWERFDFFTRRLRSVQVARLAEASEKVGRSAELEAQQAQLVSTQAEQLRSALEDLEAARAEADGAHSQNLDKLAHAEAAVARLEGQLASLEAHKNQLASESTSLAHQNLQAEAELASRRQAVEILVTERDSLAQQLAQAAAGQDAERQTGARLAAEREDLVQQLTRAATELDTERRAGEVLAAERDSIVEQLERAADNLVAERRAGEALAADLDSLARRHALAANELEAQRLAEKAAAIERDDLAAQLRDAGGRADEHARSTAAVQAERDLFASRLDEKDRSLADLGQRVKQIEAERDRLSGQLAEAARERESLRSSIEAVAAQRDLMLAARSRGFLGAPRRKPRA